MTVLCLSLLIVILDQATKVHITSAYLLNEHTPVIPGCFDIRYIRNTGAAWGMFNGFNDLLVLFSLVMVIAIVVFRKKVFDGTARHRIVAGFLIGGIVGNLIDRAKLGYVVDFLDFHWRGHYFPAFNIADTSICIGVVLLILSQLAASGKTTGDPGDSAGADTGHAGMPAEN